MLGFSFWWIIPAIGLAVCVALMVTMAFFCMTHGCGCMPTRERR